MKCVLNTCSNCSKCMHRKILILTCTEHASTTLPVGKTQNNMIDNVKTEVQIKYGTSGMVCVEFRPKKLRKFNVY